MANSPLPLSPSPSPSISPNSFSHPNHSLWIPLLAAGTAGTLSASLLQPFDVWRTIVIGSDFDSSNKHQRNVRNIAQKIIQQEGILGLWRGVTPSLVRVTVGTTVYFGTQTTLLRMVKQKNNAQNNNVQNWKMMTIGAGSRAMAVMIACPISVVKTKFEGMDKIQNTQKTIIDTWKKIIQKHGIKGLYAGLGSTLIKDTPYAGIQLTLYASVKRKFDAKNGKTTQQTQFIVNMGAGASASGIATAMMQPLEVIATRQRLKHTHIRETANTIMETDGIIGFWRGIVPRLLRRSCAGAISWATFEHIVKFFNGFSGL